MSGHNDVNNETDHISIEVNYQTFLNKDSYKIENKIHTTTDPQRTTETTLDDLLDRAIKNCACLTMNGATAAAIEVWLSNEELNRIEPLKVFWSVDKISRPSNALKRLMDRSRSDFVPIVPLAPGVDLAGRLWKETMNSGTTIAWENFSSTENLSKTDEPRLHLLSKAKFGLAAGVPFDINNHAGIIVYVFKEKLVPKDYQSSLLGVTDLIGAILSAQKNLQQLNEAGNNSPLSPDDILSPMKQDNKMYLSLSQKFSIYLKKSLGAGAVPPPPMPFFEVLHTFAGCLVAISIVGYISQSIDNTSIMMTFRMAPLGSMAVMAFALTKSPPAQPGNIIFGQAITCSIAYGLGHMKSIPLWFCQAMSVSLTCAVAALLGLTHPPAGASAVIIVSEEMRGHPWDIALILAGNVLIIIISILVNNLNPKRIYPSSWNMSVLHHWKHKQG